ncbi:MAG: inositol monophosphatase family protein [Parvularculaceae bacterium]|nr:inositol monophosphatase family protein [Parvularculaceae bacterium]
MDIQDFFEFADELAATASDETLSRFRTGTTITNKEADGFDPVTEGDREAEKALRALIASRYPDHGIKGEEFPETIGNGPWRWVLDPIDGTRAFICGVPVWTTLIGLEYEGEPVFGIIDQPFLEERWVAYAPVDGQAQLRVDGAPGRGTSGCRSLGEARMMVTDVREGEYFSPAEAEAVNSLAKQVRLTRQGLDSYGFGLVASGQMDLVVEAGLHWHDIAAVIPVIRAAGGTITDWQGAPLKATDGKLQIIAAATEDLAAQAAMALTA